MSGSTVFDRLDADQRGAVALRLNGAVSAGAGSGKTTVLAARYLDLVFSDGADVRSILCLTFTKKAQAEMQSRVWRELSASDHPLARAQVARFSEASISTIDSFCGSVLRSSAQDYGYAPDFAVDNDRARQIALDEALRFLLARREEPALASLFALMGFERAWRGLFAEAAYRLAHPALRPEGDFSAMPGRAAKALDDAFARALRALDAAVDAGRSALAEGEATTAKGRETAALFSDLAAQGPWSGTGMGLDEAASRAAPLADLKLQHFGSSPVEKGLSAAAKAAREAAQRLGKLAGAGRDAPLQAAILGLLADFAEAYRAAKRAEGVMGFRDAAVCAVDLLSRRLDIRAYYKRRYRFIMVDEFQDDDELQKELLYLLAEAPERLEAGVPPPVDLAPDKLFFVGDDKQSIYRFRGADVAVFNRLGEELKPRGQAGPQGGGAGSAQGPRLRTNYRSEPGLVGFFNGLFARVFEGASEDFEARFEDALPRAPSPGIEPSVSLFVKPRNLPSPGSPLRGHDEALADGIARFIVDAVAGGSLLLPDGRGGTRPAGHDDFAILLRSTSKQYLLERFFRLRKLPYSAQTMRSLFVESPANDVYAALRLALLPSDRTAYATVLRSPLAALSDDGFVRVLASGLPAFDPRGAALLTADDGRRYARGAAIHEGLAARVDREPTASLVSWLWFEAGLRLSILRRPDAHPYLEHYDYLFALASKSDGKGEGASTFLSRIEPLMG
jgi:ATP-dependent exoDNAse (exonuclease V) beta subunit